MVGLDRIRHDFPWRSAGFGSFVRYEGFVEAWKKTWNEEHSDEQAGDEAEVVHVGEEQEDDECGDDDEGGAVVDADDAAVAAVIGRDPVDPCLVGHEESDGEPHQPLHTERDQHNCQHARH